MEQRDSVGDLLSSAASSRKSRRSSLADSSKILATSEVDTDSPRPLAIISLARSRNSRSESEMRIDSVCCWALASISVFSHANVKSTIKNKYSLVSMHCQGIQFIVEVPEFLGVEHFSLPNARRS